MHNNEMMEKEEIFSKVLRAGRRTYFFDVRATKADDYYLTITESKKFTNDDGSFHYKKHKIYLYKEDFNEFNEILKEMTDYIINEKGDEVISERHQKDFKKEYDTPKPEAVKAVVSAETTDNSTTAESRFTDVDFDDI
ncbi:PUR family DNA/RNA-binding protein [Olleya sp. HaHaR_3_96]|uniref:PUR family DNA/RNA-binding protein n=1 Tax=Olleya sp. HaHaR_3_96 TaxID=2745560 RepID=UPI001C4E6276|nr:PUR family DNA/RNA-binding protein [Olleya sp. HaHaR_3_96]QXP61717.1 PUR family DNA/RNA-binding protein [Olleya sp. HaHaR_3_96]